MRQESDFIGVKTIPPASEMINIVLSKTQRKTPTVVHPGWIEGTIQGEVGFQSPGGLYYNSLVTLDFGAALERF